MMRNRKNRVRRRYSVLATVCLLIGLIAACVPLPTPSGYVLIPLSLTPAAAVDDSGAAPVAAAASEDSAVEIADGAPSPISHRLQGREACTECHAIDDDSSPSPADHVGYTDAVCLFCHLPEEGEAVVPPLPADAEADFCLACHGPFDALAAITADTLVDELGIVGNPHMYVPHDGTEILSCDKCHEVHPIPLMPEDLVAEANINYCYGACHHEKTFEACTACHNE